MRKRKKRTVWIILGLIFAVFLFFSPLASLVSRPLIWLAGDSLDLHSRWLMGLHGIDCGRVRIGGDPTSATDCALKAQRERKAFRVRYDIQGFDSAVAGGIVRTSSGELYALSFVGNPSGSGGTSLLGQETTKSPCPQPYHLWVNPKGRINCFQQALSYPANLMSPNFEPY